MIFGDKNNFAIEVKIDPKNCDGTLLFGDLCYWINGEIIGDSNIGSELSLAIGDLALILWYKRKRSLHTKITNPVAQYLYLYELQSNQSKIDDEPIRYVAHLRNVDSLTGFLIFAYDTYEQTILLYNQVQWLDERANVDTLNIKECRLPLGVLEEVVSACYLYLNQLYENLETVIKSV